MKNINSQSLLIAHCCIQLCTRYSTWSSYYLHVVWISDIYAVTPLSVGSTIYSLKVHGSELDHSYKQEKA